MEWVCSRTVLAHGCTFTYTGQMRGGRCHGFGRASSLDGSSYDGQWQEGKRQGQGITKKRDGGTDEGRWEKDKRQGPFICTDVRYEGKNLSVVFKDGEQIE
ncbi:hypothetical protein B484DRAFT_325099 [Ochromonadaceae sp. CCMP2298]|nr:hypothetical protein B484DRAFT_325099 [Ochromonadaceae sp. CCMP2298]